MGNQQRGGTILGFIFGLLIGLGIALGVAVYVTKVPVPFINNGEPHGISNSGSDRTQNWDPNSPLYGSTPAAPAAAGNTATSPAPAVPALPGTTIPDPVTAPPAASADPLGDLASAQVKAAEAKAAAAAATQAASANDGFNYFVQAGAFRTQADAEAQKARLAIQGWEARITEREQNGRPIFRVRIGPFGQRGDAEQIKQKLDALGVDSALIRIQR